MTYAKIADNVSLRSAVGHWSSVGTGATLGSNSPLGSWTDVGHYARIGNDVEFGPWACVGIDAVVDSGCELGSHEYVRSGHRRYRNGTTSYMPPVDAEDIAIYRAFDRLQTAIPAGAYSNDAYALRQAKKDAAAAELAALLPAFLARRANRSLPKPGFFARLFGRNTGQLRITKN